jgi:hypothetical protein
MRKVWRGRVRDRVWKAFIALAGQDVSTGELVRSIASTVRYTALVPDRFKEFWKD